MPDNANSDTPPGDIVRALQALEQAVARIEAQATDFARRASVETAPAATSDWSRMTTRPEG